MNSDFISLKLQLNFSFQSDNCIAPSLKFELMGSVFLVLINVSLHCKRKILSKECVVFRVGGAFLFLLSLCGAVVPRCLLPPFRNEGSSDEQW